VLSFISEVTAVGSVEVLKESKDGKYHKVKFRACLQTVDEVNANRRIYPKDALSEALSSIKTKISNRTFLGELDHPIEDDQKRQVVVLLKNASHVITKVWISGKEVLGEGETLSTPHGQILTSLIKDRIPIGFSLRALGNVEMKGDVSLVKSPIYVVAYDAVSNPSHREAIVREVMVEHVVCINGICFNKNIVPPIDYLFESILRRELRNCK